MRTNYKEQQAVIELVEAARNSHEAAIDARVAGFAAQVEHEKQAADGITYEKMAFDCASNLGNLMLNPPRKLFGFGRRKRDKLKGPISYLELGTDNYRDAHITYSAPMLGNIGEQIDDITVTRGYEVSAISCAVFCADEYRDNQKLARVSLKNCVYLPTEGTKREVGEMRYDFILPECNDEDVKYMLKALDIEPTPPYEAPNYTEDQHLDAIAKMHLITEELFGSR